jgi:hypothetical protein
MLFVVVSLCRTEFSGNDVLEPETIALGDSKGSTSSSEFPSLILEDVYYHCKYFDARTSMSFTFAVLLALAQ